MVARLEHERAARRRFVDACTICAQREGLRPSTAAPTGLDVPDEAWIHGTASMDRRPLIGIAALVMVATPTIVLLSVTPWVGVLVGAWSGLVVLALVLAWQTRRSVVVVIHASRRPLGATRLNALCREILHSAEVWDLWVFSRGGFDLPAIEAARVHGVRCFERNGHGFDEHPRGLAGRTRSMVPAARRSTNERPAA